jgi:hypothetical protein
MDLPAVFSLEFDSQREWWALKSPAILKGLGLLKKKVNFFWWAVASGAVNREAIDWARF